MDPIALGGVALVLLVKESGVPIPVPGDLIVIGTGAGQSAFGAWADATCPACLMVPVFGLSSEGDRPGRAA